MMTKKKEKEKISLLLRVGADRLLVLVGVNLEVIELGLLGQVMHPGRVAVAADGVPPAALGAARVPLVLEQIHLVDVLVCGGRQRV